LPEVVGNSHGVYLGKKSGRHSIEWKLKEMGKSASDDQIEQILSAVKKKSEDTKSNVSDEDFARIIETAGL
jgi:isopropylmalate/homocitrate/citramalate synthase